MEPDPGMWDREAQRDISSQTLDLSQTIEKGEERVFLMLPFSGVGLMLWLWFVDTSDKGG